jgi:Flp pilus assembly protein TadG
MINILSTAARAVTPLRNRLNRLKVADRGVAMIEAAFMIPLMLFLTIAGVETVNIMVTHTKMSAIALGAADNASRIASGSNLSLPQVREADINDVFIGAERQAGNLALVTRGRVILSSVQVNADGRQQISWQRCYGNLAVRSAWGPQGTVAPGTDGFPQFTQNGLEVEALPGTPVILAEISYSYRPILLGQLLLGNTQVDAEAAYFVRDNRDTTQVYNPSPAATVRTCPTGGTQRQLRNARNATQRWSWTAWW